MHGNDPQNPEELLWGEDCGGAGPLIDPELLLTDNKPDLGRDTAPLKALRPSTVKLLATLLNPTKIIPTDNGLLRDWRGLAELAGIPSEQIIYLESVSDPTTELIRIWGRQEPRRSTDDLKAFLAVIDRFDISDDITPFLESDIVFYWSQDEKVRNSNSVTVPEVSTSDDKVLTIGDTQSESPSRYDAFILYAEEDSEFAMQIVDKMENEYNLKMCVKDRDLLGGSMFEHEVIGRIIEERCNRLLAVFSPNFLKSQANQFLVSYAQALALETRQRKIIPCMYIRCELPPSVRYSFCLDYNRSGKLWNFWDKLSQSLRTTPLPNGVAIPGRSEANSESAASKVSASLPASATPLALKDPSFGWWDAQKTSKPRQHSLSTSDSGVLSDGLPDFDTLSLQSGSPLLKGSSDSKTKGKWYKKIMGSNKKKRVSKGQAEAPLAEAL